MAVCLLHLDITSLPSSRYMYMNSVDHFIEKATLPCLAFATASLAAWPELAFARHESCRHLRALLRFRTSRHVLDRFMFEMYSGHWHSRQGLCHGPLPTTIFGFLCFLARKARPRNTWPCHFDLKALRPFTQTISFNNRIFRRCLNPAVRSIRTLFCFFQKQSSDLFEP